MFFILIDLKTRGDEAKKKLKVSERDERYIKRILLYIVLQHHCIVRKRGITVNISWSKEGFRK